ncbi:hypothetical protein AB0N24_25725 [Arthrobacter sp. NPDC093128]|uniref:hypothetical protein n=1 Tax=Arthrobacter sp. NPDC093128 TaxID=3154979 RepID=UPI00342F8ECA
MYNIAMLVPSKPGVMPQHFGSAHSDFLGCLVSCLPSLIDMELEAPRRGLDGTFVGSFQLHFDSERHWKSAQISTEWVDLIDATSHLFDWDSVKIQ